MDTNLYARKNLLLFMILGLSCLIVISIVIHKIQNGSQQVARHDPAPLPPDVERVLTGYSYSESNDNLAVSITGKKVVLRGRKFMGLRSTLTKTNFFNSVAGTLKSDRGSISFSASDAEWDAQSAHPFWLKKNVAIVINDKPVNNIKSAKIFFKNGRIEVISDRKETFYFK